MKFKKSLLAVFIAFTLIMIGGFTSQKTADASSWHYGAIPSALRGHWSAKSNSSQGITIYRHYIHYSGERSTRITKWKYLGNHFYKFVYPKSDGFTILLHYFNHHKITMNSYWHSYYR